jgi:hypothetical protein
MDQKWFEMSDVRRRRLDTAVWIPLRASHVLRASGKHGYVGHLEEFFGVGSVAIPVNERGKAKTLGWQDVGLSRSHKGCFDNGRYVPADVFELYGSSTAGSALVLGQDGNSIDPSEWHLHQDFVITLGLKKEGDIWVSMDEGYVEVARLKRDGDRPVMLEVRAEHLKDYLCARGMALFVSSYRSRKETVDDAAHIAWANNFLQQISEGERWEGRKTKIHEGGHLFGSSTAVFHVGRENIDPQEDVPHIGPFDSNITSESWTVQHKGRRLIRVWGELWRDEWVEPAEKSPRVRRDKLPSPAYFITDAEGSRCIADELEATGGWLWFRAGVIAALCQWRGGRLQWYTRETGGVTCSPGASPVAFGVNRLGLVNVYAKDIGYLPHWTQMIWVGFNVGPEGGVSEELLAAQAKGSPADSQAPEEYLPKAFDLLNNIAMRKFDIHLFRAHDQFHALLAGANRFRATDAAGIFSLAKDLARLTADAIDAAAIQRIIKPTKGEKWGSLKSLEALAALQVGSARAHEIVGPLFATYELRHADAHLPPGDLEAAFALARIDRSAPFVIQGCQLLHACVSSLYAIADALERFPEITVEHK